MDGFNALISEVSQKAEDEGVSFETALTSVLSESDDMEESAPDAVQPADVITAAHLAMGIIAVVPTQMEIVLSADNWTASDNPLYPYAYKHTDSIFTPNKRTDMYISPQSTAAAMAAGFCEVTDTRDGYVLFLAKALPSSDIDATLLVGPTLHQVSVPT